MKSVNILAVDRIFKINVNPLNDRVKGTVLEHYTKEVYYSYDDIEINVVKRIPDEPGSWLVNDKYKIIPEPKRGMNVVDMHFADEKEVIAAVVALNEVEYNKHVQRQAEAKAMAEFLLDAITCDSSAAEKLK